MRSHLHQITEGNFIAGNLSSTTTVLLIIFIGIHHIMNSKGTIKKQTNERKTLN